MFNLKNKNYLLLLAFIEGMCVMACELIGAKMIAPFFGSSLYVWAAVLGVTLFSLMSGYYIGGYLSEKLKNSKTLLWVLLIGGLFIILMPFSSIWIMSVLIDSSIQIGSTLSLMIFLFPPLALMGMTSPIIINLINEKIDTSGRSAGKVYAISTLGGILGTFLTGFYLLPEFGIKWPCFAFGAILIILPLINLIKLKIYKAAIVLIPLCWVAYSNTQPIHYNHKGIKLLYSSEGVLGQVRVYEMDFFTVMRGTKKGRLLMVNNTAQTIHDVENPTRDLWDYSYFYPTAASVYPKGSDALLLGLGGASFLHHFNRLGFETDVVELDQRIVDVAIDYFNVDPATKVYVDDARRYINTCDKKYDVVMMDLFLNETPPAHVLTKESFERTKSLLKKDGLIMINFFGYITGEKGKAARSILKTLKSVNLEVEILPTPGLEEHRNLIFLAAPKLPDFSKASYELPDLPKIENLEAHFIDQKTINLKDAEILTDDRPILEKLYLPAAISWRKIAIKYNLKKLLRSDMYQLE